MATRRRTIVGSPLTPGLLTELGLFGELAPAPNGFVPDGTWSHTYRVLVFSKLNVRRIRPRARSR